MDGIRPRPGGNGSPQDFVGHEATTTWAVELLLRGQDLLVSDPRRMGKSEWLRVLPHRQTDFQVVYIDYEGVASVEQFLLRTAEALAGHAGVGARLRDRLRALFDGLEGEARFFGVRLKAGVHAAPRDQLFEQTIKAVEDAGLEQRLLVAQDEVPTAILNIVAAEGPAAARILLQTLRRVRGSTKRVRWIVCGSVGIHHALRAAQTTRGPINDLMALPFGPLEGHEAHELARRLFLGINAYGDNAAMDALVAGTDGIPFFMHAVVANLEEAHRNGWVMAQAVLDEIDRLVHHRELGHGVMHLVTRIDEFYPKELIRPAYDLLDQIAEAGESGVNIAPDEQRALVDLLIEDHYLQPGKPLRWRYSILRRVWMARRGLS